MKTLKIPMLAVAALTATMLHATEYFVDCTRPDDTGDGLSEATAKRTVQAAIAAAEADKDTPRIVTLLPGTYAEGGNVYGYKCEQAAYKDQTLYCTNRVYITKGLTLRAKDPSELTEIVGAWDTSATAANATYGVGPAAVRCVLISTGERVVIQGLTLRDGACQDDNTRTTGGYWPTYAGGVAYTGSNFYNFLLVDCTVRHCSGKRGAACSGGKLLRCRVFESYGTTLSDVTALHSAIYDQRKSSWGQYAVENTRFYNCTVFVSAGNGNSTYFSTGATICNSLVFGMGTFTYGSGTVNATNSVTDSAWVGVGKKDEASVFGDSASYYMFKSPLDSDWSLRDDSAYLTLGDAKYIADLTWAADFEPYKDLDGNTLPTTGAIAPGCTQSTFTPACGAIVLNSDKAIVDGTRKAFSGAYFYAEEPFAQHKLTPALDAGEYLHSWNAIYGEWRRFPAVDNSLMVMPPPGVDTRSSNTPQTTTQALWVSPTGSDTEGDGSQDAPFKTLLKAGQAANELAKTSKNNYFVVFAAAGTYDTESATVASGLTRVYDYGKSIRFIGAGAYGEGTSVIAGALDPDVAAETTPYGRGPKAIRCGSLSTFTSCFQNFELKDGRCASSDGATTDANRGGGIFGGALIDCHLVNVGAARGQACYDGRMERCRLTKPDPIPGARIIEGSGYAVSCIFEDAVGRAGNNGYTDGLCLSQCTLYPYSGIRAISSGAKVFNCLSTPANGPSTSWNYSIYGLVISCSIPLPASGTPVPDYKNADPQFVDYKNGDFRLKSTSPAIGYGSLKSMATAADDSGYWKTYGPDINGKKVLFFDGKPLPGAVQEIVQSVNVSAADYGTMVPTGVVYIEPGSSLTVSLTAAKRPPRGLVVDGVETSMTSVTIPAPDAPSGVIEVSALFGTNWYANATGGADINDGFTPETAKKTLISLCTNQYVRSGDVIHAAAGDYNEGAYCHDPKNRVIRSRAIVKAGVTLVGDEGQDVTFITGAPAEGTAGGSTASCGATAVRCVTSDGGGVLKGFTLRDGYAHSTTTVTIDTYAGGYLGLSAAARICDCTITNCYANRSPMAHGGTWFNCSYMGNNKAVNTGFDGNNMGWFGGFYNCRILTSANWTIDWPIVNCIMCNKSSNSTAGQYQIYASSEALLKVTNTIFACSIRKTSDAGVTYRPAISNNIVCTGFGGNTIAAEDKAWFKVLTSAQIQKAYDTDSLAFKGTKSEHFCDAGVNVAGQENGTDITGGQRIYNGTVDLGPSEYDWRGDYAAALGAAEVTAVSPAVKLTDAGKVRLTHGTALCLKTAAKANRLPFEIEDGTLTVGETAYTASGKCKLGATAELAFDGEGYADLGLLYRPGMVFMLK